MRILIIHNHYQQKGGEDTVVQTESGLLRSRGHAVACLTFHNDSLQGASKARALLRSIYNPQAARALRAQIAAFRPDVIHVHNLFYVASPSVLYAAARAGVPVVYTLHNYRLICPSAFLYHAGAVYERSIGRILPWDALRKRVWNGSLGQTLGIVAITATHKLLGTFRRKVSRYVVFTEFARSLFVGSSLGAAPEQFFIKPNFVPDLGYQPDAREAPYLFIGRLSPEKGIRTLLAAVQQQPFPLQIMGDGPLRAEVEACAATVPSLTYLGPQPRAAVMAALRTCRALIFPSEWYEGMPMVLLEALSVGCPIILSGLGNPASMIPDGTAGLHITPGGAADLCAKVAQLEAQPALRQAMSQAARALYEDHYSPEQNYRLLMRLYEGVLPVPQPRPVVAS